MTTQFLGNTVDDAGLDYVCNSTRVRATRNTVTFTDSSGSVTVTGNPIGVNYIDGIGAPPVNAPGATFTLPANQLFTGIVVMRPTIANTLTTDTAANILTAANALTAGVQVGDYIPVLIMNDSAFAITMAMGAGVTSANASTTSIAANTSRYCQFRFTNATLGSAAITMYF